MSVDQQSQEDNFFGMNKHWQKLSVVFGFLAQLAALFFWGGGINTKVAQLQEDFNGYYENVRETNMRQRNAIQDLQTRVSVAEALANACVSEGVARGTINMDKLQEDGN